MQNILHAQLIVEARVKNIMKLNSVSGFWCYLALSIAICSGLQDLKHIQKKTVILKYAKKEKKKGKKGKKPRQPPIFHTSTSLTQKFFQNKKSILEAAVQSTTIIQCIPPSGAQCSPAAAKSHQSCGSTWVPIKKRDLWNPKETKHLYWKYAE